MGRRPPYIWEGDATKILASDFGGVLGNSPAIREARFPSRVPYKWDP